MTADQCIPNIGVRERRKRMTFGIATLVVGVAIAVVLIALGVDRPWRLTVFVPLLGGAIGVFQAREKT